MKSNFRWKLASLMFLLVVSFITTGCGGDKSDPAGPQIAVSSRDIANGNAVVNNPVVQTVTVRNPGSATLNIGSIAQANPLAPPFSIVIETDRCSNRSVPPGSFCEFQVRFLPTSQAPFNDSFDIPSNAANENSVTVTVSGIGKALRVAINQVNTSQCGSGLLELLVSVTTSTNNIIKGLMLSNFSLFENNQSKTITEVSEVQTALPISVALALDYSTSLNNDISNLEAASTAFINSMSTSDEAAIIKFARYSQVMQDFTTDKTLLATAINTPPPFTPLEKEETYLYDALWSAIEKTAARQNSKALVLISDGRDEDINFVSNVSTHKISDVIAQATAKNVVIFTIGLGSVNGDVMSRLANETGGQYFYAPTSGNLSTVYAAIRNLLVGQYSVKYSPVPGSSSIRLAVTSGSDEGEASRQVQGCQ